MGPRGGWAGGLPANIFWQRTYSRCFCSFVFFDLGVRKTQ